MKRKITYTTFSALLILLLLQVSSVFAAGTIQVNTTADEFGTGNSCSLREAVQTANTRRSFGGCVKQGSAPYDIQIPAGTYTLSLAGRGENNNMTGDLDILNDIQLLGAGANNTIIQAGPAAGSGIDRVLHVPAQAGIAINNLTIRYGSVGTDENGGGVANDAGRVTFNSAVITVNSTLADAPGEGGGGIYNGSWLRLNSSEVSLNTAVNGLGNGGGIFNAGYLEVNTGTIRDNQTARAGGGIENFSGDVRLNTVTMMGNSTAINGGALHTSGAGSVSTRDGSVLGNSAGMEGGGLWNSAVGTMNIDSTSFEFNTASGANADQGGGALFNDGGSLTVRNANISNNMADGASGSGGGILNNLGTLTVHNSNLNGNSSNRAGGGIESNVGSVELANTNFSHNSTGVAPGNGGALHVTGAGNVTAVGGRVINNTAAREGGGFWNGSGQMSIDGTHFSQNIASGPAADDGGGALFNNGGTLIVTKAHLQGNVADGTSGSGGGILNLGGTLNISHSHLEANISRRAGGGIEDNAGVLTTLDFVTLLHNQTGNNPGNGGGLHITGTGTVYVSHSTVTGNTADAEGGGLWNSAVGILVVDQSTLNHNSANGTAADQGGGGLFNDGGTLLVSNSTLSTNTAVTLGGGLANFGDTTVTNSTLFENSANGGAGGIDNAAGTVTLLNSIVAHVQAVGPDCAGSITIPAGIPNLDSDGTCGASQTGTPGLGALQNNGGNTQTHALLNQSQALNAGDNATCAATPINNIDQRGVARSADAACDLGAFEQAQSR